MDSYKSSDSRLVSFFKKSRDQWKEKAIEKQKKIKALKIKVRDLSKSRDEWKKQAKQAQQEVEQLKQAQKKKNQNKSDNGCSETQKLLMSRPVGHTYPVFVIQLAIQLVIEGLISFRGAQRCLRLLSQFFAVPTPSFSTIRNWLFRLGLYELQKKHNHRDDWILILDLTIELGKAKCLVILGIPAARLKKTGYSLQHKDVEILDLAVLSSSKGEIIAQKLKILCQKIGPPLQILSDHGSDLRRGISLYRKENPGVIYTYDVTHKMALLLKGELEKDERFQSFLQQCRLTRQKLQQTDLYFLVPPKERSKSRYLNLGELVSWAKKVLELLSRSDFSNLSIFSTDNKLQAIRESQAEGSENSQSQHLHSKESVDIGHLIPISQIKETKRSPENQNNKTAMDRKFREKLGWLKDYQSDVMIYSELMNLVELVHKQLKHNGLNQNSVSVFTGSTSNLALSGRAETFKGRIESYLAQEGSQIPSSQTLLATSDTLESIFGKYKLFSEVRPFNEMGLIVLIIPLLTTPITSDLIKQALESVRTSDLELWAEQVFGQSMLSKRRAIFT